MLSFLVFFVSFSFVRAGFFDLTDVEDPLALLWNLPVHQKITQCIIDTNRYGTCMDKPRCLLTGGTPSGKCGPLFTCCSYDTDCVKTSDKKQGHFESRNLNTAVTNCKYTIRLRSKNVCQVRLDFEEFYLAPATLTRSSTESDVSIYKCVNDALKIDPDTYGVPVLCGNNTRQHLYIHFNTPTEPRSTVNLDINIANRLSVDYKDLQKPSWKIKFTQLECPMKRHKFDFSKYAEIEHINEDFSSLAPQGAIQYFTETHGEIRSFGLDTTAPLKSEEATSYPYSEHYSIAFKRPNNVCGIKFTATYFNVLRSDKDVCYHYLYIPEYFSETSLSSAGAGTVCSGTDQPFYSLVPGPFYVNFKSMDTSQYVAPTLENRGFILNYELQAANSCPLNNNF
ncbi:uncharacterized protein LOC126736780 [Anthonomus grandis grandis]|uniref:uncharacterized protein LOC126736780 n=1 Tax=Anthonomus grandis grandis TaxID=2921223 RepID=UPI002164F1C1|nr:uncharacterized protein LOC126736780 [Anthonomus grandis grandis]